MTPVIVIGKRELTPLEQNALHTIGFALAEIGRELHTTATPGAPEAVAEGYRAAGKEPVIHTAGLADIDGETICILDMQLGIKLDQRMPDWQHRGWVVLQDELMLDEWTGAMLAVLEDTGRSLVAQ